MADDKYGFFTVVQENGHDIIFCDGIKPVATLREACNILEIMRRISNNKYRIIICNEQGDEWNYLYPVRALKAQKQEKWTFAPSEFMGFLGEICAMINQGNILK